MGAAERIHWTAVCKYPGKDSFRFYSPAFVADWQGLDDAARSAVEEAWSKISPHPAPDIIDLVPGYLEFVGGRNGRS